jgi:regulator of protease activity HflC (stomatin/prohibitin superfamily)
LRILSTQKAKAVSSFSIGNPKTNGGIQARGSNDGTRQEGQMNSVTGKTPRRRLPFQIPFVGLAIAFVAFLIFSGSWYTVDAGERAVVLRLGALKSVTGPGLHFKVPFVEDVRKIDVRVSRIEWAGDDAMESYSKDQQPAHLQLTISYRILADNDAVAALYSQYGGVENFKSAVIIPRTMEGIKTVFGQFNAVTVIQERAKFNQEVEAAVRALIKGPVAIEGVQIQDIAFSEAYEQSVEARMQAQVEVERFQQNKSREQLQADIRVIQAKADAQAVQLKGEAEAAAIRARGSALRDNPQLVGLTAAERWNGVLPTTMLPNSAVPFVEMSPSRQ